MRIQKLNMYLMNLVNNKDSILNNFMFKPVLIMDGFVCFCEDYSKISSNSSESLRLAADVIS